MREESVVEESVCGGSLGGFNIETRHHKVEGMVRPGGEGSFQSSWLVVGDIDTIEDRILGNELPVPGTQNTETFGDVIDLVNVRVSREDWVSRQHLSVETANGPDVHLLAILRITHQQLWSSVPPSGNII